MRAGERPRQGRRLDAAGATVYRAESTSRRVSRGARQLVALALAGGLLVGGITQWSSIENWAGDTFTSLKDKIVESKTEE